MQERYNSIANSERMEVTKNSNMLLANQLATVVILLPFLKNKNIDNEFIPLIEI